MTEKRKLLLIAERFPPDLGGVARSALRTAQAIAGLGWEVHVLAWTKTLPAGVLETFFPEGHDDPTRGPILHRLGLYSNWDFSLQHTWNVLEHLHGEFEFSAVWGHYLFPAGYMAVVFAESAGIASTVSARGNDVDRLMFPPGDFSRLLWTLQRATLVSCVSRDLASKIKLLLGDSSEIVVLPNVVDTELFTPLAPPGTPELRTTLGIHPEEVVLGFCGELRHKKGLPHLFSALHEVRQTRPACLLVIGEVRPREQAHITTFAAEHPADAGRILVTGHLESPVDVARHLHLCDVTLQPSVWDGLPNAVLESMACGKIVVASDAGGIPEAVEHGVHGFLVSKMQLPRFGEAIGEVLDLPAADRVAIAAAARERMETSFHSDVEGARLEALLSRVAELAEQTDSRLS
ncbi:MAG: glycosyl transferase family 1 [Planctomycetaceae bacterium]|nr:glycosyl transferase family 1 [Planctomycetaceae bacterium]